MKDVIISIIAIYIIGRMVAGCFFGGNNNDGNVSSQEKPPRMAKLIIKKT